MKVWGLKRLGRWVPLLAIAFLGGLAYRDYRQRPDYDDATARAGKSAQAGMSQHYDAVEVIDGDTIRTPDGRSIRLCGIDAPEVAHRGKPGQALGEAAKGKLEALIKAAGGRVIVSPIETDRYGRTVAEVFVPLRGEAEKLLNYELVRAGMAYHYRQYSQNCPNGAGSLEAAEAEAKRQRLGVWARDYEKPWEFRRAQRQG
jgi:micrococcal nuclease